MAPATQAPPRPTGDLSGPIELPVAGTGRRSSGRRRTVRSGRRSDAVSETPPPVPVAPPPVSVAPAPPVPAAPPPAPVAPAAPLEADPFAVPAEAVPPPRAGDPVLPDEPHDFFAGAPTPEASWEPSRFSPALMIAVLFILIGVLLGLLALWVDGGDSGAAPATTAAPVTTAPTTAAPTTAAPTTAAPTTAAPTTAPPTTVPPVPLAGLPVEVLNGAGIQGAASGAAGLLTGGEATITQTTNADRFDHAVTKIVYGDPAHAGAADEVRALLGVGEVAHDPAGVGAGAAITVIIGEDWPA